MDEQLNETCAKTSRGIVDGDHESWLKARITTAIRMSRLLEQGARVGADSLLATHGLEGIINGCAIEIIHTLGLEPSYTNLRRFAPGDHLPF